MKVRKVRRIKYYLGFALCNVFFISIIFISSYHKTSRLRRLKSSEKSSMLSLIPLEEKVPNISVILLWTRYFDGEFPTYGWANADYAECFKTCQFTTDKRYLGIADAVVFHSRDLRNDEMPPIRTNSQIYIYLQQESPSYTKTNLEEYGNVFNWTMTYRQDSDVYHPYFRTIELSPEERQEVLDNFSLEQVLQQKTKLVAWVVSNCNTHGKRDKYAWELAKFIPINIYGACGHLKCAHTGEGCFPVISQEYKFYLSFENSLCADYITEKFSKALQYNLVPIVYGGGDYENVAPPGSYINTKDFKSPKALAEYLLDLDKNPAKYLEYFGWKTKYKVGTGNGWCSLCRKLTEHKRKPVMKSYTNLRRWWNSYGRRKNNLTKLFKNSNKHDYENQDDIQYLPACSDIRESSSGDFFNAPSWLW